MKEITFKLDQQEVEDITAGLESRRVHLKDIKEIFSRAEREIETINKILKELKKEGGNKNE